MAEVMEFVQNYEDLSTDTGFQFEFSCDRCHAAFRTTFKSSATGTLSSVLQTASGIFGGVLDTVSEIGDKVHSAGWEQAHDKAFADAVKEIKPEFIQCPKCLAWVCRKKCWNSSKGLCKSCAPDLGVEMAVAQHERSVEEIHAHAAMAEEDKKLAKENWRQKITATCPQCEASLGKNAKFCPECGFQLKTEKHCTECGTKLEASAKFCSDCGHKV